MPIHIGMLGTLYFYASGLEGGVEKILFRGGQIFQKFNKKHFWHLQNSKTPTVLLTKYIDHNKVNSLFLT